MHCNIAIKNSSIFLGFFFTFLTISCSINPVCRHTSEQDLQIRVNSLWSAKVNKDWGTVYDLTEKKYRDSISRKKYINKNHLDILDFTVTKIEIDKESHTGKSFAKMKIKGIGGFIFEPMVCDN